jgi:hypothetical protein
VRRLRRAGTDREGSADRGCLAQVCFRHGVPLVPVPVRNRC